MSSEKPTDQRLVYPILEVKFQTTPMDPHGTATLCVRTSEGWIHLGVTRGILEDLAIRFQRVAKTMPDVPSSQVKRHDLA